MKSERSVTAAVVELDALADAIWSGTKNHDLRSIRGLHFVFFFIRRIEIRRMGFEFRAASVHTFVNWNQSKLLAESAYVIFTSIREVGESAIGKRGFLE